MAQTWSDNTYQGDHNAATDLQNMENNFNTLKSLFSGAAAPSNTVAGMPWMDTTKKLLKYRNSANSAWLGLMHGDTSQKILVYRNAAMDGWAIDSGVTDRVIALKGGSTYTTGGATAGTWTISGLSHTHSTTGSHTHGNGSLYVSTYHRHVNGSARSSGQYGLARAQTGAETGTAYYTDYQGSSTQAVGGSTATANAGSTSAGGSHDGTWRPAAVVCTLQYLDI